MSMKTKVIIQLIAYLIICLYGGYRFVMKVPATIQSLMVPILLMVAGFIGFIGNVTKLKKIHNDSSK
ncbi:hypothetical protein [Niallia sp. Krafla_26]|uniref:hypothetical protein n=1 Tax=Niallia sp. Krafla_26 TaxID=3064703 RepID=UPI003D17BD62